MLVFWLIPSGSWRQETGSSDTIFGNSLPNHLTWRMFYHWYGKFAIKMFSSWSTDVPLSNHKLLKGRFVGKKHFFPLLSSPMLVGISKLLTIGFHNRRKPSFFSWLVRYQFEFFGQMPKNGPMTNWTTFAQQFGPNFLHLTREWRYNHPPHHVVFSCRGDSWSSSPFLIDIRVILLNLCNRLVQCCLIRPDLSRYLPFR